MIKIIPYSNESPKKKGNERNKDATTINGLDIGLDRKDFKNISNTARLIQLCTSTLSKIPNCLDTGQAYAALIAFVLGHAITLTQSSLLPLLPLSVLFSLFLLVAVWKRKALCLAAIVLGMLSATVRFDAHLENAFPQTWERKDLQLTVKLDGLPQYHQGNIRFNAVVLKQVASKELANLIGKKILLSCYRCKLSIEPNQTWKFTVRLKRPHGYASKNAFDYEKYLFRQQVIAKGYIRTKGINELLEHDAANLVSWRYSIKKSIESTLGDGAGFSTVIALTIGDKSGFSKKQKKLLQETGLSHLFVISGLHIGLVFVVALWLGKWFFNFVSLFKPRLFEYCPRSFLVVLPALAMACFYSALAGFSVSTQRAMIMLTIYSVFKVLGKEVGLMKVLLIAASLILIIDPFSILDSGFWLSCSAVTIIAIANIRNEKLNLFSLQPLLWLGMLPLTVSLFGQVSLVSPLVNLIAVPLFCGLLIPLTILVAGVHVCLPFELTGLALKTLGSLYEYIFEVLTLIVKIDLAAISLSPFTALQYLAFCALFIGLIRRWRISVLVACLLLMLFPWVDRSMGRERNNDLVVTLLDVGQGLAMVIQSAEGVTVYDTGPKYGSGFTAAEAVLIPYLRSIGAQKLKRIIVSHADNDHIGGYWTLTETFSAQQVLTSRPDKIPEAQECISGMQWKEGETEFRILSPDKTTPSGSNNRSCVLLIEHGGTRILLSGDIEKQVEQHLLQIGVDLSADVLLVPHQGSKTSSTQNFIDAVNPSMAMVAAGYLNHYGHPNSEVINRYKRKRIPVLSTITSGSIEVRVKSEGFSINQYRRDSRRFWHWRP